MINQHRSVQHYVAQPWEDEDALTAAIIQLARQFGRYGYRRITALLRQAGWNVKHKRLERIWRREGLKVPRSNRREDGSGLTMARVYDCVHSTGTTSGLTTSSWIEPTTGERSAC